MKKKILIIDDDEELCEELAEVLQDQGFHVDVANNVACARELLVDSGYEVIILDLKLPEVSGVEILKEIKKLRPSQKVLILSGKPLSANMSDADEPNFQEDVVLLTMADVVLNKPVQGEELLSKIIQLASRPRSLRTSKK